MNEANAQAADERSKYEVSIVIPVFNRVRYTFKCLQALAKNTGDTPCEVILVDNGSTDGTAELLASLGGDVRVISNAQNLGFAKACNQGAQAAQAPNILFLNNDTEVQPGWLPPMLDLLRSDPATAVVGSKLVYPQNGRIQHAGVVFRPTGQPYHVFQGMDARHFAVNSVERFQAVTGACLLIRAGVFFAVGQFDEAFINGFEDIDLCLKVGQAGHRIYYTPRSVVLHHESISAGRKTHDQRNGLLFLRRWMGKVEPDENRHYARLGMQLIYSDGGRQCTVHYPHAPHRDHTLQLADAGVTMDPALTAQA